MDNKSEQVTQGSVDVNDTPPSDMPSKENMHRLLSVEAVISQHCPNLRKDATARARLEALLYEELKDNTYRTKELVAICGEEVDRATLRHEFRTTVSEQHREWALMRARHG